MKDFAKGFYKSQAWKRCCVAYRKAVGGLCEECLANGILTPGEIVHHKKPLTPLNINDPTITLDWSNLRLLCREHHAEAHKTKKRRYAVDEHGHVVCL